MPSLNTHNPRSAYHHRESMLAMLENRELDRRSELGAFPRQLDQSDNEEADSPCPIFDTWFSEGGADAVRRLTNFTPREINLLWSTVRSHVTRYWNVGRGRRSQFTGKDVLFMLLAVMKHGGTWDMNAHVFQIKTPTFIKTITSFCHVVAPRIYNDWVRDKQMRPRYES